MSHDHTVEVTIQSGRGTQAFSFPQQTKVQEAANEAAGKLGYPPGGVYALVRVATQEQLAGERTLVSYHLKEDELLSLSATGSGV